MKVNLSNYSSVPSDYCDKEINLVVLFVRTYCVMSTGLNDDNDCKGSNVLCKLLAKIQLGC